jgi:hypothetical protein
VSQGVVYQQCDGTHEAEACEDEDADLVSQALGRPGGTLEEVVEGVQSVALAMVGWVLGLAIVTDASEGVFAQTHDPGEQEVARGGEGGLGESGLQEGDERLQRAYHVPHGGTFLSEEPVVAIIFKDRRNPLLLHLFRVQENSGQESR